MFVKVVSKARIWEIYKSEFPLQFKGENLIPPATKDWLKCMEELGEEFHEVYKEFDESYNLLHPAGYMIGVPKSYIEETKAE